jgi:ABC-type Fe3+/spermidine/putrescine transport system ATPase subunit
MFLEVSDISKKGEEHFVLSNILFSQKRHQKFVIAGETGSGKSTLLKIIAGLVQPDSGEVVLNGERIKGPEEKLVAGHSSIAYLSQHFELPHSLRVEQVLTYANVLQDEEAEHLYKICRIDYLLKRRTNQLSGGERQRIALAKLLIASPQLLLLDEPFSHLDMVNKNILKSVVDDIVKKLKMTCLLVSHDPSDTLPWADQIIVIKDGNLIQKGSPEKIYFRPVNEYVAGLFGKYNIIPKDCLEILSKKSFRKELIVRPERIKTDSKRGRQNKGVVTKNIFFGSHYEVEVSWNEMVLIATTPVCYKKGSEVYLSLDLA